MYALKEKTNIPIVDKMKSDGLTKIKFPYKIRKPKFEEIFQKMAVLGIK